MTTPALFNITKLLNQLAPCEYNGKSVQDGLCFLALAQIYHATLLAQGVTAQICWIMVLNKLTEGATAWAGPHIVKVATGTAMPWADFATFETAFKAHFCAVDDEQAAVAELIKVCKASHKLGTIKEYTAEFNTVAACTKFSNKDKLERYHTGLPYKLKDIFAQGAHDISTLVKLQKVALSVNQNLAMCKKERPKQFGGWKKRGKKAAASGTGKKTFECWNCGETGHRAFQCKKPKVERPQAASLSSSTEVAALQAQLKEMKEQIAALTLASKKEGF